MTRPTWCASSRSVEQPHSGAAADGGTCLVQAGSEGVLEVSCADRAGAGGGYGACGIVQDGVEGGSGSRPATDLFTSPVSSGGKARETRSRELVPCASRRGYSNLDGFHWSLGLRAGCL
jgi:hypothetical protein